MWKKTALPLLLVLVASDASATDAPTSQRDASAIRTQQAGIRHDVLAGTPRYAHLDAASRTELLAQQDRVDRLLAHVDSTAALPERLQIELFNALESISALVNNDPGGRLECWRERPVGTLQAQTRCSTARGLQAQNQTYQRVWKRAGQR
ncbi:MAG: hypothetical protein ACJ8GV_07050 [Luteimonas sp.]